MISDKRRELGLTQCDFAKLLGTQQSNISAYESGKLEIGSAIEKKFRATLQLSPESLFLNGSKVPLGAMLKELQDHLGDNIHRIGMAIDPRIRSVSHEMDTLRYVIGMNDEFQGITSESDQMFFLQDPGRSGNSEIDALIAGMANFWSRASALERVPAWTRTRKREVVRLWFVGLPPGIPILEAAALSNGIPDLRSRGILIDRINLESL